MNLDDGPLRLGADGSTRMTINESGNVGVGLSDPQAPLHVKGGLRLSGDEVGALDGLHIGVDPLGAGTVDIINLEATPLRYMKSLTDEVARIDPDGVGVVALNTRGVTRVSVGSDGNVGIGTTDPQATLDVAGRIRATDLETAGLVVVEVASVLGSRVNLVAGTNSQVLDLGDGPSVGVTISGGHANIVSRSYATVGGGGNTASGHTSIVPGGFDCEARGTLSFAAGRRAKANHDGAFVWADNSTDATFESSGINEFAIRSSGGARFITSANLTSGVSLAPGGTSWSVVSDRNRKKDIEPLDPEEVLDRLVEVPISSWRYQWEKEDSTPHIGPMAQDFKGAFFPDRDDKVITTLEADGVALAAIQGLNEKLNTKEQRIRELEDTVRDLAERLSALEGKK